LIAVSLVLTIFLSDLSAEDKLHIFRCIVSAQGNALQSRGIARDSDGGIYTIVNENNLVRKYSHGNPPPIITDVAANATTDMESLTGNVNSPTTRLSTIWNWLFGDRISSICYSKRRFMTENIWRG
jgi:hypothetical protein